MPPYSIGQRVCDMRLLAQKDHYTFETFPISAVNNSSVDVITPRGESFTIPCEYIVTEEEAEFAF